MAVSTLLFEVLDRQEVEMKWEDLIDWGFLLMMLTMVMLFAYLAKGC
jgi:hypothetical protein